MIARRHFLVAGLAAGGGLLVGCSAPDAASRLGDAALLKAAPGEVALNGWLKVGSDGRVIVALPRAEMGQGVSTSLAMLVAEELDADWGRVSFEPAPIARIYANTAVLLNILPLQGDDDGTLARFARGAVQRLGYTLALQITGGSSSIRDAWEPMRLAGATARALLVQAAAQRWQVPASELVVAQGLVRHPASNRQAHFGELAAAAAALPVPADVALKAAQDFKLIGKPVPRNDLTGKVNGQAPFGIDARPPGLVYAAIRQCPVFGGKVRSIDAAAAVKRRGIKQIFVLGDSAVVAVADSFWRAKQALAATQIDFDDGPNAALDSAAIGRQLRAALDAQSGSGFRSVGDADAVLATALRKVEAEYEVPFLAHAALEPINCTAQFKDGALTLWCGTQVASLARWRAAQGANIKAENVTLNVPFLGGGFGRRLELDMIEQAVAISLKTGGAPVTLLWTREEDMQHDLYRPAAVSRFAAALSDDGAPLAWRNRVAAPSVGYDSVKRLLPALAVDMPDKNQIEGAFDIPYAIPNLSVRQMRVATPVPVGSWRSVGHSYNAFFTECFIDELAATAGKDAVAYRLGLLGGRPRHRAVLELAASKAGWGKPWPAGRALGVALHESFASICAQVVEVSIEAGVPRVHRVVCALDCGVVVNPDTVDAQLQGAIVFGLSAALGGAITIKAGRVEQSNFHDQPLLRMAQMPLIETFTVPSGAPPGGVGELGTPPIAPALANALSTLIGKRLRRLPIRPEDLAIKA